ncbi:hypothetical protein [Pelagerythrobacter rhizovicinus]|uniref:Uncharacterized protein n=1 Tax=Pelagerythrobacter rhizovicinus TaxID=2268576 RepID=A0A4Q2KNW9_9SPHN|nr:hypothetical protein [Pelagerythrobacter rhizovicinus]RXZ66030.1 hypothetical protein ETX26_04755 [Pelagerythrobacter rhizovicinus]
MKRAAFAISIAVGLHSSVFAQDSEQEKVVAAVKAVSSAISDGTDLASLDLMPELDEATITELKSLKGCDGSALRESTLEVVRLFYRCGKIARPRNGPIKLPRAATVELHFEGGSMTKLTVDEVQAVPVGGY